MSTKIKSLFMVLILASFTTQYAVADNFNQEDMAFAFSDSATSDLGQMDLLSSQEMMETEGEFWRLALKVSFLTWVVASTFIPIVEDWLRRSILR